MAEEIQRPDGREPNQMREITAQTGIVPNADGSARFSTGNTIAIASVYGPKEMHPQHEQDPQRATLRCNYDMLSFSVKDRNKPGPSRRSKEISKITEWALQPAVLLDKYSGMVVDVHIKIVQADAGTRCAGINAAALALAHAGVPMKNMVSSISIGKLDKSLVVDLDKDEEDYEEGEGATDIPISMTSDGKITHMQLDGQIKKDQLKEGVTLAKETCEKIYEIQKSALKNPGEIKKLDSSGKGGEK